MTRSLGADGGWCRRRSSKPFRGADGVPGGFDSHTLPSLHPLHALRGLAREFRRVRWRAARLATTVVLALGVGLVVNLANPAGLAAQEGDPPPPAADSVAADSVRPDTAGAKAAEDSVVSPVVRSEAVGDEEQPSGPSPMSAFLRSVLIPGWGQLAADQPVRGAVYFALQSATVYMVIRTQNRIDEAESEGLKEARREQREDWLVLAGFWALASGVDAWVSAEMWGFEGEVVPPPEGSAGVAVRMRVPVAGF